METLPIFHTKVLQTLSDRYGMSCTLEELTSLLTPIFNATTLFKDRKSNEKENQERVLDALILLKNEGHIFLNSSSYLSTISIKGLIVVDNKAFCN